MSTFPKVIVVVGPTASGKSDLGVKLARKYNGEIISADSRQVYRGLNVGSGKITKKEMQGIPHHLLDITSPRRRFTVAQYKKKADKAIHSILKRGKVPILVGGTGFYIQAVTDDLNIPQTPPDIKLRRKLDKSTTTELFTKLQKLDPDRAQTIDKRNKRRIIRAIEIAKALGKVPKLKKRQRFNTLFLSIDVSKEILKKNIEKRLLERIKQGMITEVKHLHKNGVSWRRLEELGLEYRYIARFLQGKLTKDEVVDKLRFEIRHYAKRQLTWFRRDKRIHWIRSYREADRLVKNFLRK